MSLSRELLFHIADEANVHEILYEGKKYFFGCVLCNPEINDGYVPSEKSCEEARRKQHK